MAHGHLAYTCSYPKDTPTEHPNSLPDGCSIIEATQNNLKIISFDGETGWAIHAIEPLTAFFGRRLDKVDGLSLELSYTGYEDDFRCCLYVKNNKFSYLKAQTTFEPLPMSMCEINVNCDDDEDDEEYVEPLLDSIRHWINNLSESYEPPVRALAIAYVLRNNDANAILDLLNETERAELATLDEKLHALFVASAIMKHSKQIIDTALAHKLQDTPAK